MSKKTYTILLIDDDPLMCEGVRVSLSQRFDLVMAHSGEAGLRCLSRDIDVVILDIRMAPMSGFDVCTEIRNRYPDIPIIFFTAYPGDKEPFDIINHHKPFAFIVKSNSIDQLEAALHDAVAYNDIRESRQSLQKLSYEIDTHFPRLKVLLKTDHVDDQSLRAFLKEYENSLEHQVGISNVTTPFLYPNHPRYRHAIDVATKSLSQQLHIMIVGGSGTGKTRFSQFVATECHPQNVVMVRCASPHQKTLFEIDETLPCEHRTFAKLLLGAHGVLILDDIHALSRENQDIIAKLITEHTLTIDAQPHPLKLTILATTSKELSTAVASDQFSDVLYNALCPIQVRLPTLKEVPEVISEFIPFFTTQFAPKGYHFPPEISRLMTRSDWPGNIRDLEIEVKRYVSTGKNQLDFKALDPESKKKLLIHALKKNGHNIQSTAAYLGIKRPALYSMIAAFGLAFDKRKYRKDTPAA